MSFRLQLVNVVSLNALRNNSVVSLSVDVIHFIQPSLQDSSLFLSCRSLFPSRHIVAVGTILRMQIAFVKCTLRNVVERSDSCLNSVTDLIAIGRTSVF